MSWCNQYMPSPKEELADEELYGPEPYDLNFCFPIDASALENERIKLTPYIPRLHAQEFFNALGANPQLVRYLPFHPPTTLPGLVAQFERFRTDTGSVLFVIIDKTRAPIPGSAQAGPGFEGGSFAGVICLLHSSEAQLSTEIGCIISFPEFQRTHVHSNATGLLLNYCLNLPSDSPPGLGLRRVQWCANSRNEPSVNAAIRLGFQREALLRWYVALPEGKEGNTPRPGDRFPDRPGRDTVILAICWDEWETESRQKVRQIMERKA